MRSIAVVFLVVIIAISYGYYIVKAVEVVIPAIEAVAKQNQGIEFE